MVRQFTKREFLGELEAIGFRDALSDEARKSVAKAFAKKKKVSSADPALFLPLAVTMFDAEMIEGDGPDNPLSYHSLLTQLAEHSFGRFAPTAIVDRLDHDAHTANVAFTLRGRSFDASFVYDSDWVDGGVIDFVNRALAETGATHRFFPLPSIDQCVYLAFVPEPVWKAALERGVVPEQDEVEL